MESPPGQTQIGADSMLRTTSWKLHAIVIISCLSVTSGLISIYAFTQDFPAWISIILTSANFSLNWTALAYAIYIYKIYDDAQTKTVKALEGKGIKVKNVEEGLSELLEQGKKFTNWFEANKSDLQKVEAKIKTLDLGQLINSAEEMGKMAKSMKEHGFTQERFEKLFVVFEKVDLDRVIDMIERWNTGNEERKELEREVDAWKEKTTAVVPQEDKNVQPQPVDVPPLKRKI